MPIKQITTTPAPGHLVQICGACGAEHTISLDRGGQKSKTGPFAFQPGDTLVVRVDSAPAVTMTFAAADFPDFARVTATELAAKLPAAIPGVHATDDGGGLLLESVTTGDASRIEVVGGTARGALGFATDGGSDPCCSRPVLGISLGGGEHKDKDVIALRRCNDCGANECLVRTFDAAASELDGTHFKEHRKAVNALAEHCKASGWSHSHVAELHAAETARPPDLHTVLAQGPVVLPPFVRLNEATAARGARGAR